jgi:pilus assembly protein CpaB
VKTPPRTTLLVAVTLAAATGFVTLNYVTSVNRTIAAQAEPERGIIVAKVDIPARVAIDVSMLRRVARPVSQIEPDAVIDAHKAIGSLALVSLPAGSTITSSRIGRPQSVALAVVLKPGMRAVSIGIDRVKAVGGLIQPGDRVDVIAVPPRAGNETPQGRTILRGAVVLASGTQMESVAQAGAPSQPDASNLTTVTLGVTPAQADVLATADVNATLRLALRSPREAIGREKAESFVMPTAQPNTRTAPALAQPPAPVAAANPAPPVAVSTLARIPAGAPRGAQRPARDAHRGGVEIIEEGASARTAP